MTGSLRGKLPHLFTASPHLGPYVISVPSVPALLGTTFALLAAVGVFVTFLHLWRRELEWRWALLLLWMGLLLALSQGARAFIDIPSARTLFYLTTPLAIAAAFGVTSALERLRAAWPRNSSFLIPVALALILAPTAGSALNQGLQSINHSAQANATLTPDTLDLLEWLKNNPTRCGEKTGLGQRSRMPPSGLSARAGMVPHARRVESERAFPEPDTLGLAKKASGAPASQDQAGEFCPNAILIDDWNRRRTT
jgi:hypothetical protein